jgi:hypothetical protein
MLHAPNKFIRPEPFTPQTLIDAERYFMLAELVRVLEGEIEAEMAQRPPGQRGRGRREQILAQTVQHLRRATHCLKPAAGLESWRQAADGDKP